MPIDKDTVSKVSNLARIEIDDKQLKKLSKELDSVIEWINSLNEVETEGKREVIKVKFDSGAVETVFTPEAANAFELRD